MSGNLVGGGAFEEDKEFALEVLGKNADFLLIAVDDLLQFLHLGDLPELLDDPIALRNTLLPHQVAFAQTSELLHADNFLKH